MELQILTAWAQEVGGAPSSAPAGNVFLSLLPFILIFVIFYFLLILPQQRKRKEHRKTLEALKKGDRVVTTSGFLGTVANIHKEVVTLQMADNVKFKIKKEYISDLQTGGDQG